MNTSISPATVHLALPNGRHTVVLCDPSRLAASVRTTTEMKYVTCFRCIAFRASDADQMKAEIHKRMTSPGAKGPT